MIAWRASTRPQLFAADHKKSDYLTDEDDELQRGRSYSLRITTTPRSSTSLFARASTRPQLFAADHLHRHCVTSGVRQLQRGRSYSLRITIRSTWRRLRSRRFNEAAAIRCGSQQAALRIPRSATGFNEAAAIRCGSRGIVESPRNIPHWLQRGRSYSLRITGERPPTTGDTSMLQRGRSYSLRITTSTGKAGVASVVLQRGRSYSLRITHRYAQPGDPSSCSFNEAAAIRCGSRGNT